MEARLLRRPALSWYLRVKVRKIETTPVDLNFSDMLEL